MKKGISLAVALLCSACGYDVSKGSDPSLSGGVAPVGAAMSFNNVFASTIRPVCLECHSAPRNAGGLNLDTYEAIVANKAAVQSAVASRFMPESVGRSLTPDQRRLLLAWLEAGAPRDGSAPNGPAAPGGPESPNPTPSPSPGQPCDDRNRSGDDHPCDNNDNRMEDFSR